ncbi:GNAT family N-acetyltransferase [Alkalibacterium sp. f15]|uniref:GNAT family N-acetyltransferase n=1 Tax=Alkalibacterium sp. f15 TaxID=3414029 RepID=UPI003BF85D49
MLTHKVDEEISLKLKENQDSPEIFALIDQSRKHLKQWMTWVDQVQSVEDIDEVTYKHLLEFTEQKAVHFVIQYNGEVAGSVNINDIDWSIKSAEIGYWLGSEYTGKGIMFRTVKSLLDYAFEKLGLHKIEIWAAEGNSKSRSIPERLGFVQEGMRRDNELIDGKYVNMIIYGILEDEWSK